ncbi:UbiA prenyltransferase [Aureococcus anophagefferens]|uniref:UbiA prenyltransferase n=1 Tax=Aureococcus anophagefferens TaxID=44056 RepID=A0ABR1G8T3_AURAN
MPRAAGAAIVALLAAQASAFRRPAGVARLPAPSRGVRLGGRPVASVPVARPTALGANAALDENSVSGDTFLGALYKFCRPHTIRGTILASVAGVAGFAADSGGLKGLYALGTFAGTAYSVPPFKLKARGRSRWDHHRDVPGFLLNFGVYYATLESPRQDLRLVTKDLPDVEGDRAYGVKTFATRVGVAKVAAGASLALALNYWRRPSQGAVAPPGAFARGPMVAGHAVLLLGLGRFFLRYRRSGPTNMVAIKGYYKSIWDLFYLEYLLYIFIWRRRVARVRSAAGVVTSRRTLVSNAAAAVRAGGRPGSPDELAPDGLGDRPKEAPKPAAPAAAPAAAPPKKLSAAEEAATNKAEAAGIVKEAQKAYDARIADREKAKTASKDELQKLIDLKISGGAAPAAEEKKAE